MWRNSQTRLCLWHIKRAILTRLRSKKEQQRFAYIKESDLKRFPFIDPTFRPIPGSTSLFCPVSLHKSVVTLIERHFNLHPLIPIDVSGGSLTPDQIHYNSTKEVYDFCRLNDLSALWLYLFSCWYSEGKYSLWARSCHPQIPFSKTTMMIEAHWKVLKRDYLYRFNRPRLDYVIYIICEHLLPQQENRLLQLLNGRQYPHWWEEFKREWKKAGQRHFSTNSGENYYTSDALWVCSCPSFLQSRFLLCKHLVIAAGGCSKRLIYNEIRRGRERPFISFVKDNHRESEQETNENSMDMFRLEQVTNENDIDSVHLQEPTVSESPEIDVEQLRHEIQTRKEFLDHLTAEFEQKNYQHVQALLDGTKRINDIMGDIQEAREKRKRARTWKDSKPWTMFLK